MNIEDKYVQIINNYLYKLKNRNTLRYNEYKDLLEKAYNILTFDDPEHYNFGLSVICHVAESKPKDIMIKQLLHDCIVVSRVFLYTEMYNKIDPEYQEDIEETVYDEYAKACYTLNKTNTILTKDQYKLINEFKKYKRLVVSAPTSFGKSRIVPEIILLNGYNNIAIILPSGNDSINDSIYKQYKTV